MAEFQAATVEIAAGNLEVAAGLLRRAEAKASGDLAAEIRVLRQHCEAVAGRRG